MDEREIGMTDAELIAAAERRGWEQGRDAAVAWAKVEEMEWVAAQIAALTPTDQRAPASPRQEDDGLHDDSELLAALHRPENVRLAGLVTAVAAEFRRRDEALRAAANTLDTIIQSEFEGAALEGESEIDAIATALDHNFLTIAALSQIVAILPDTLNDAPDWLRRAVEERMKADD